jgi:hypothetical protein
LFVDVIDGNNVYSNDYSIASFSVVDIQIVEAPFVSLSNFNFMVPPLIR